MPYTFSYSVIVLWFQVRPKTVWFHHQIFISLYLTLPPIFIIYKKRWKIYQRKKCIISFSICFFVWDTLSHMWGLQRQRITEHFPTSFYLFFKPKQTYENIIAFKPREKTYVSYPFLPIIISCKRSYLSHFLWTIKWESLIYSRQRPRLSLEISSWQFWIKNPKRL